MKIYKVTDKRAYMPLLLLGDEQESMVEKYIDKSELFVLDDGGIKGEIAVCEKSENVLEIKNLAVLPQFQHKGYGRALIDFICETYRGRYTVLTVGTGDSPLTVPFYEKCGFKRAYAVKNFFTDNYDHPIIEAGVTLKDMIYFEKQL